ncbi:MAG: hypothetical protein ACK5MH_06965 [Bacteroidales bacterium]
MNNLGIKATIYDIIGYLVPGFLSIISIFMIIKGGILNQNGEINFEVFQSITIDLPFVFYVIIFTFSYISGHIIESISSFIYKKILYKPVMKFFMRKHYDKMNSIADNKFKTNFLSSEQNFMSYCELKYPVINDTVFRFLSFYGFSRNITIILILVYISLCINGQYFTIFGFSLIISILAMSWNYFRFRKYFELKIISVLDLEKNNMHEVK